ncbi:MAG: choice-of-anchor Q domain-containing protein, partial [Planctomycetota bacterium]
MSLFRFGRTKKQANKRLKQWRRSNRRRAWQGFEPLEDRRLLATLVVQSASDNFDPLNPTTDGLVTLREAIMAANADAPVGDAPAGSGADTITFAPVFNTRAWDIILNHGELPITSSITINGTGSGMLSIDAIDNSRVFHVDDGVAGQSAVTLKDLRVNRGSVENQNGAGILNQEDLTLESVIVANSFISGTGDGVGGGAGIYSTGNLDITGSLITDNRITGSSGESGGGIYATGTTSIRHSTIAGNNSGSGRSNSPSQGGGIYATGGLTIDHVVVADNVSEEGIDVFGNVTSSYSLIKDSAGVTITDNGGTITGFDPQLTNDRRPSSRSILINAGDPAAVAGQGNVPLLDVDGNARIQSGRIDIGAVETSFADPGYFTVNSTADGPVNLNDSVV